MPDSEVLAFATTEGRAVVTLNRRDFVKLHQDRPAHAGIVVCSFDSVQPLADLAGALIRVNRPP